ncbi:MAG: hypothetical protein RL701_4385 [Pseudomonadota bacterium]|jgi:hypothetical protein
MIGRTTVDPMTQIKALSVLQTIELVRKKHDETTIEQIKAALSRPARQAIYEAPLLPSDWVDVRYVTENLVAFDALCGGADGQAAKALVRELAEAQISGVYRLLFAIVSPRSLVDKAGRLWPRYYDRGESIGKMQGGTSATFQILGCPDLPKHHDWIVLPYTEVALSHAGAKTVTSRHSQCVADGAQSCISEFHWT